jgi:Protein of unknown function (DUF2934)
MSSKLKSNVSKQSQANSTQVEAGEAGERNVALEEKIRGRAYELYLERGEQPGGELDDWLQAERELECKVLAQAKLGTAPLKCMDNE